MADEIEQMIRAGLVRQRAVSGSQGESMREHLKEFEAQRLQFGRRLQAGAAPLSLAMATVECAIGMALDTATAMRGAKGRAQVADGIAECLNTMFEERSGIGGSDVN